MRASKGVGEAKWKLEAAATALLLRVFIEVTTTTEAAGRR